MFFVCNECDSKYILSDLILSYLTLSYYLVLKPQTRGKINLTKRVRSSSSGQMYTQIRLVSSMQIKLISWAATTKLCFFHSDMNHLSPRGSNQAYFSKTISTRIYITFHLGYMMTSSIGYIFRVTGHLCGDFTGPRWIPRTKGSDAELWCFFWSTSE